MNVAGPGRAATCRGGSGCRVLQNTLRSSVVAFNGDDALVSGSLTRVPDLRPRCRDLPTSCATGVSQVPREVPNHTAASLRLSLRHLLQLVGDALGGAFD